VPSFRAPTTKILAAVTIAGAVALAVPAYALTQGALGGGTAAAADPTVTKAWSQLQSGAQGPPAGGRYRAYGPAAGLTVAELNTVGSNTVGSNTAAPWTSSARTFIANLTGDQEVDTTGAEGGQAYAKLRLDPVTGRVAFSNLTLKNVLGGDEDAVTKLHVHRGPAGTNGDVVIDFTPSLTKDTTTGSVTADLALVGAIVANPGEYYLNLHTTSLPEGAARGQLQPVVTRWTAKAANLQASLFGAQEVGTVGVRGGRATVILRLDPVTGRVAYKKLRLTNVLTSGSDAVTELHIHRGKAGVNGDVVIDLSSTLTAGASSGEVTADPAVVARILTHPGNYYLNLHTTDFPKGAARGQLQDCMVPW
jgi:hypothetical protein